MISQLNQRERTFVLCGAGVLALILIYAVILLPYRNALSRLDSQITVRSQQLQQVKLLKSRYLALQQEVAKADKQLDARQGTSGLPFIENLVITTAGRENLLSMRPQTPVAGDRFTLESVEVKLEKLTLRQVLELLWGLHEAVPPMQVKNLYLKQRFDDRSLLDAGLTITSMRRAT